MMLPQKPNPRAEHRLREIQRINSSISLAEKFPTLASLTVHLAYFDPDGFAQTGEVRYKVNVQHARSVFSIACPRVECAGGDFDLSEAVAQAVAARRKTAEGELRCAGHRITAKDGREPCRKLLRYKLILRYV